MGKTMITLSCESGICCSRFCRKLRDENGGYYFCPVCKNAYPIMKEVSIKDIINDERKRMVEAMVIQ